MSQAFPIGKRIRVRGTFSDAKNQRFNPREVVVSVSHNGTTERLSGSDVENEGLGVFAVEIMFDDPGEWEIKFESAARGEESFEIVRYTAMYNVGAMAPSAILAAAIGDSSPYAEELHVDVDLADREWIISQLGKAGVSVDTTKSDNYLRAFYRRIFEAPKQAEPVADEADVSSRLRIPAYESPRERYLRRQRERFE